MNNEDILWQANHQELKQGVVSRDGIHICLICGRQFEEGVIYNYQEKLLVALKAALIHVEAEHEGVFSFLLNLHKRLTGLSEQQKRILCHIYEGKGDEETAKALQVTPSTVRNHRFYLREKEKQAKLFLAIADLASQNMPKKQKLLTAHRSATMFDERYAITEAENEAILKHYVAENGSLTRFPSKEKRKLIVLNYIMNRFEPNLKYNEKQVNEILKFFYEDYVLLRRYLIEYGFMDRVPDGSEYWVKKN